MSRLGTPSTIRRLQPDDSGMTINGRPLSDWHAWLTLDGVSFDAPEPSTEWQDVPGAYGGVDVAFRDATGHIPTGRRNLSFTIAVVGDEPECWQARGGIMRLHGTDVSVAMPAWPGAAHGLLSVGQWTVHRNCLGAFCGMTATLTVDAEPLLHGDVHAFDTGVGGVEVWVEGDRATGPVITATPPDGTRNLHITINDSRLLFNHDFDGMETLVVDCSGHKPVSGIGDSYLLPTVDSDYPLLVPGRNTASITAGRMHVEYTTKWMI